jgi:hypothetical protein
MLSTVVLGGRTDLLAGALSRVGSETALVLAAAFGVAALTAVLAGPGWSPRRAAASRSVPNKSYRRY